MNPNLLFFTCILVACSSPSVPTPEQLDALEQQVRAENQPLYVELNQRLASGQISQSEYKIQRASLDHRVLAKVDTMAWSRHALVESEMKANGVPTPDRPVVLDAPGVGTVQGSLYSSSRINGLGNQIQGNMMRDLGGGNFNQRRAGTIYD